MTRRRIEVALVFTAWLLAASLTGYNFGIWKSHDVLREASEKVREAERLTLRCVDVSTKAMSATMRQHLYVWAAVQEAVPEYYHVMRSIRNFLEES